MKRKGTILLAAVLLAQPILVMASTPQEKGTKPIEITHTISPILSLNKIEFPSTVKQGEKVKISFTLENTAEKPLKDVIIEITGQDKKNMTSLSQTQIKVPSLSAKEKSTYNFEFLVGESAEEKTYPFTIQVSYCDKNGKSAEEIKNNIKLEVENKDENGTQSPEGKEDGTAEKNPEGKNDPATPLLPDGKESGFQSIESTFGSMPITGGGDFGGGGSIGDGGGGADAASPGKNSPKVIIEEYSTNPGTVNAGSPFTLSMKILNTNDKKSIRNIRVALSADAATTVQAPAGEGAEGLGATALGGGGGASAFTPVGSSNTFYIDKIGPKKAYYKDILLTTANDLAPNTYSITANFEYEDSDGNTYSSSEIIGLLVNQKSELTIGNLDVLDMAGVGEPVPVTLEFYNTGKSTLSNVMVKMRGNLEPDTNVYFVGNMDPGASESYDVNVTANATGKQEGEIVITYDDSVGQRQEMVQPLSIDIDDFAEASEEDTAHMNPEGASPGKIAAGLGAIALLIGGIAFYVVKKRKNQDNEDLVV